MNLKSVKRRYKTSDAYMTQEARLIHALADADLERFTAYDNQINAGSQAAFFALIVSAESVVSDTAVVAQQLQAGEALLSHMEAARAKYNEVKYYVRKAFPDSRGTWDEFGVQEYPEVRKNPSKMILFLGELWKTALKYEVPLLAAGYTTAAIAAIDTIGNDLLQTNTNRNRTMRQRPGQTEERIIALNACHAHMTQINAAAQLVYAGDYAKRQQFVFFAESVTGSAPRQQGDGV